MPVYFQEEQPELAERLDRFLEALATDLIATGQFGEVKALLLAGGYGRGEGGVFHGRAGTASALYNDLEFYLVLEDKAPAGALQSWAEQWSHRGEEQLGIEVEFKLLRDGELQQAGPMRTSRRWS